MTSSQGRITFWGMEVFVATAEEGSITAAARRLGSSTATVSQQITNLETAIGTPLLNRGARPVTLTPAGDMFLLRANTILNEAEQAQAELAMADLSRLTRFRLGMIEDFDADVTPALLGHLASELKKCHFLLETGASHRLLDQLDARALDVVVAADMGPISDAMETFGLMEEPFVVATPKGATRKEELPSFMGESALIHYTTRHHMGRLITDHLSRQNITLRHRFELDSYHSILSMVAQGAGWAILTPLGWLRAGRFVEQVDVYELPFEPLSRRISLTARREVLGDMPEQIAEALRPKLQNMIIEPAQAALPWLGDQLRLV